MQANFRDAVKSLAKASASLTRLQQAAIVTLVLLLCFGGIIAYARSRPKAVDIKAAGGIPTSSARAKTLTVHIAGAVLSPGLYSLPEGSRVADALNKAGGPAADAMLDDLNLAARLQDAQKILVPRREATVPPVTEVGETAAGTSLVNVNTADAAGLDNLPGVGPSLAARIIDYRKKNGPFSSVEDLDNVEGIGPSKLESLRDLVAF
ncbi:MAG: helix-hairpin-helix domain-containing protein [Candidatus Geothermincolia bacterium]